MAITWTSGELVNHKKKKNRITEVLWLLSFLKIMSVLSQEPQATTIATPGFANHFGQASDFKLDKTYDHAMQHFQEDIKVDVIS